MKVRIKLLAAVLAVLGMTALFITPLLASPNYGYLFEPDSSYSQSDNRAALRIYGFSGPPYPVRVDWIAPGGAIVSYCPTGGCGVSYDQDVADNGILNWRTFYFYISGQSRQTGTYTAVAYSYSNMIYSEMFRDDFTISDGGPTPTPPPCVSPAEIDTDFGVGGLATADFGGTDSGAAVALQPDGKIVVAGDTEIGDDYDFAIARFNQDGSLDTSFSSDGLARTSITGDSDRAKAVALQPDGKLIAAGSTPGESGYYADFALARFNNDGSLDPTFGVSGITTTDIETGSDYAYAIALQPDGKILVAGHTFGGFALLRYNANGTVDTTFGSAGMVLPAFYDLNDEAQAVAVQPDGKILLAGNTLDSSNNISIVLLRYNSSGSLDTAFGDSGIVLENFGGWEAVYAMALQPDGKILVTGSSLIRFNVNGTLDTSFGSGGRVLDGSGNGIAIQTDGKILIVSASRVRRFNIDGSIDTGFGSAGSVTTGIGTGLALQPDGRMIVVGSCSGDFKVARYGARSTPSLDYRSYLPFLIK